MHQNKSRKQLSFSGSHLSRLCSFPTHAKGLIRRNWYSRHGLSVNHLSRRGADENGDRTTTKTTATTSVPYVKFYCCTELNGEMRIEQGNRFNEVFTWFLMAYLTSHWTTVLYDDTIPMISKHTEVLKY